MTEAQARSREEIDRGEEMPETTKRREVREEKEKTAAVDNSAPEIA